MIVPDESALDMLSSYYPFIKDKLCVIEHGYDPVKELERKIECSTPLQHKKYQKKR